MKVIVILGSTGIGKTNLSIELAKRIDGEIINADSTQVYKELDIATAKVTKEEMSNIPHHLFDIKNIDENYTVYDYQKDARNKIEEISKRGHIPILVGGTGLYIKACLYDYNFNEEIKINNYDDIKTEDLYERLLNIDNNTIIHKNNRKRIVRALNYYDQNGKSISEKGKTNKILYDVIFIGLRTSRDILYERINKRVDIMVNKGLLEEVKKIYDSNIRTKAVLTPIGYKELFSYFENKKTLEECLEEIKLKSRKYAKRQDTWNKHQFDVKWIDVNFDNFEITINEALDLIK